MGHYLFHKLNKIFSCKFEIILCKSKPKMQFLETISLIFRMWQIFGLSPLTLDTDSFQPKLSNLQLTYSYLLIILESIILIWIVVCMNLYTDWTLPKLVIYLNLIMLTVAQLLNIVIYIEALAKRATQIEFYRKMQKIDNIFAKNFGIQQNYKSTRRQIILNGIFWIMEAILLSVFLVWMAASEGNQKMTIFIGVYMLSTFTNMIRYMQFITFVCLIKIRCEVIKERLMQTICFEADDLNELEGDKIVPVLVKLDIRGMSLEKMTVYQEIILLRQCYHCLWEASAIANRCFRWTMLFALGNHFFLLVTNFYWTFLLTVFRDAANPLATIVWAIVNTRRMVAICNICYKTIKEVRYFYLNQIIHNVLIIFPTQVEKIPLLFHQLNSKMTDSRLSVLVGICLRYTGMAYSL